MPVRRGIRLWCEHFSAIAKSLNRTTPIHRKTALAGVLFCLVAGALSVKNAAAQLRLGNDTAERCTGARTTPRPLEAEPRTAPRRGEAETRNGSRPGEAEVRVGPNTVEIDPPEPESAQVEPVRNTLPPGDHRLKDLEINGVACVVKKGDYVYQNVNIWGGGSLTFEDAAINFHAHSILVENGGTLDAGMGGPITGPVTIWLYGSATDGVNSITCKSGATCGVPELIWKSNPSVSMMKMPTMACTPASKIAPSPVGKDCFYPYEKLDPTDPLAGAFFGRKVLAVSYGGTIFLRGAKGIRSGPIAATPSDSGTSWVRLTDDLAAGVSKFHVDRPVPTWANNDHIVLTSTDYLPSHSEEVIVQGVSSDAKGTLITLQAATKFPHYGTAYDYSGVDSGKGPADDLNRQPGPTAGTYSLPSRHLETRAAVALLTRSIMIASEGDSPVLTDRYSSTPHFPSGFYGGHTVIRSGVKQYQIQGVEYYQLGQGGAIGRYPIHFHMDRTVPPPTVNPVFQGTYVADSSIHESNTRFITVHATQGLLLARNVGYRSIGHGFYLEDATETNNKLYSNIGIQARAAIYDDLNPRSVPGILSQPGNSGAEVFPFHSDYDHPSVFWIMNTWNDFQYNVAVGAGTCGACYWMPPSGISGSSVYETWDSYAGMQVNGKAGVVPLLNFVGNSCSTAMNSIETVGNTVCLGIREGATSDPKTLGSVINPPPITPIVYPTVDQGLRQHATVCNAKADPVTGLTDCTKVPTCSGSNGAEANCATTTIDHFTTSFNWAAKNFSSVWLRGWWYLMQDSAITDVQGGGLTLITGGGYTRSDSAQGFWNLSLRNLFVGNTQPITANEVPDNPAASNAGPFNPSSNKMFSLSCPYSPPDRCVSKADGIIVPIDPFSNAQRLFNIYDGPVFEDADAYADIHVTKIGTLGSCKSPVGGNANPGSCQNLDWANGYQVGVLQNPQTNVGTNDCILPNAAIAWKQPNGFYYPPAFHSKNLAFENVDIRHFVVEPFWNPNSFTTDFGKVKNTYCSWENGMFGNNFTDIDRQTELSDDDGALTGLTSKTVEPPSPEPQDPSISVNKDPFFNAPLLTPECASAYPSAPPPTGQYQANATADASPYQYASTVVYHFCDHEEIIDGKPVRVPGCTTWGGNCSDQRCSGVPLYRQYLTGDEVTAFKPADPTTRPVIRLMGQVSIQRSNLTFNHGSYYIDTTLDQATQMQQIKARYQNQIPPTDPPGGLFYTNVFEANQPYYVFFLFATKDFHQTYSMYIGKVAQSVGEAAVQPARVQVPTVVYNAQPVTDGTGTWITKAYDPGTGLLTVTVDLEGQKDVFNMDRKGFCQPASYCTYSGGVCGCNPNNPACKPADNVCSWGVKDIDCPIAGCFGFVVTMPDGFVAAKQPNLPPAPIPFVGDPKSDPYFKKDNVTFFNVDQTVSGAACRYAEAPMQK